MMPMINKGLAIPDPTPFGATRSHVPPEMLLDEDRIVTKGLMRLSERALASVFENEPDIYTVDDLKVRFR